MFMVVNYEDSLCHVAQLAHQDGATNLLQFIGSMPKLAKENGGSLVTIGAALKRKLL